ncbi:MAG: hypothetical protein IJI62_03710, partial [Lachnospiraceae bacterium]|nr:hypothetical protein [Lachnospiraceae bacterium]
ETVTNTYETKPTKGEVKVQKILNGREWTDTDSFTFTISAPEGTPMPAETSIIITKADADQTKSFGEITFAKAGTYTYTVKETKGTLGGVTYDEAEHTVTIKVKDDGNGNLVAEEGSSLIQTETITNTYKTSGTGEVKVKKVLKGREWTDDDAFTFTISAAEGTPMPAETSITITKADTDQTKSFGEITFAKAGTYTYTVKETKGSLGGVTYDEAEHTVTIKVKDDGNGNLVAEEGSSLIQTETVTNTYETKPTKGEVKVQKVLNGRAWTDTDSFTFTISAADGTPMPAETSIAITKADTDQTKSFGEITFAKAGTYTYTVKETKGTLGGVTYDEAEHTVTIKVKDDGNGKLIADETLLIQTVEFTNTYSKTGEGEVKVKKTLDGRDWAAEDSFEFTIIPVGTAPAFANNKITVTKNSADYTESFGKVTFTEAGTYQWTVSETYKGETRNGITYDSADRTVTIVVEDDGKGQLVAADGSALVQTAEFTNEYGRSGEGEVKIQKTLIGRDWATDDRFEFTITPIGDAPAFDNNKVAVTKDSASYMESFGKVKFTTAGTYKWKVSETHKGETIDGITYDSSDKTVTIVVKDDGHGNLIAEDGSSLTQTAVFENNYAKSGEGEVKVQKTLSGREWESSDSFEFTITPVGDAPAFMSNTAIISKDSADHTESFGKVTFTEVGTYQWVVSEKHKGETLNGVTYDDEDKTVTIVVKDDGKGHLIADDGSALTQTAEFANTYNATGTTNLKATKLIDYWGKAESFTFVLEAVGDAPMPAGADGRKISKTVTKDNLIADFGEIEYTKAGSYQYTITETDDGVEGIEYDTTPHMVEVVADDNKDGTITASVTYDEKKKDLTITNKHLRGDLKLTKTLVSDAAADKDVEFTFTVTMSDKTISGTYGEMNFTAGSAEVKLKGGESAEAKGLPVGIDYTITEAETDDFELTAKIGDEGTISTTPGAAEFTNTRKTGDLELSKVLVSDAAADAAKEFEFTVTLGDTTISGEYGDMNFTAGTATVKLKGGQTAKATGLPTGVEYTITEKDAPGFDLTKKTDDTGMISTSVSSAVFTNTRKTGGLSVSKSVVSSTASDKTKAFSFTVTLSDTTISGEYGEMTFKDGIARFTLKHGETISAEGLPTEIEYTVVEEKADGFVTTKTGDTGTISETKLAEAVFTNTKDEGGLVVSKSVVSDVSSDKEKNFSFTVTLGVENVNGTYGDMTFENGEATFTLKDGENKTATGLAKGISYTVKEVEDPDFDTTSTGTTGTISNTAGLATFTNMRKTGNLTLSKKLISDAAADKDVSFTFIVELSDKTINKDYGGMNFANGVATVTLKGGESVTAIGLPIGIAYKIIEAEADGFELSGKTGDEGTISTTTSAAAFTNTRKTGELQVTKTVESSTASDRTRDFGFKVTLGDSSISGTYDEMTFTGGVAEFTLKHGEAKLAAGLPVGISYTVEENAGSGYTVTMTGETGSISVTRAVAAFTNTFTTPPPPPPPPPPDTPPGTPPPPSTPPETPYVLGATRTPQVLGASRAQTGDDSDLQLWLTLMMASAAGMIAAFKKRKREQEET